MKRQSQIPQQISLPIQQQIPVVPPIQLRTLPRTLRQQRALPQKRYHQRILNGRRKLRCLAPSAIVHQTSTTVTIFHLIMEQRRSSAFSIARIREPAIFMILTGTTIIMPVSLPGRLEMERIQSLPVIGG